MAIRDLLKDEFRKALGTGTPEFSIAAPPRPDLGDYATNLAFLIAGKAKKSPSAVAENLLQTLLERESFRKIVHDIRPAGGFLNITLRDEFVAAAFAKTAGQKTPLSAPKRKETVLIDYSSPNIGKPLSIAHIRSTIIGDALARLYRALGYRVISDNHLGDWGLQAGILIAAYKLFEKRPVSRLTIHDMLSLYVRFHEAMQEHKELESKAKLETKDLQDERPESLRIWNAFRKNSIAEFMQIYRALGIKFDYMLGESTYRKLFSRIVEWSLKKNVAKISEGAVVIPLAHTYLPPVLIRKSDGGYLYHTFDLATMYWRNKHFKPHKVLYVVANEQAMHFEQLFGAAKKLGWMKKDELLHVKFGMVRGEDLKRLSTRKGKTILLEEIIEEAVRRARKIVEVKNPKLPDREKVKIATAVGIGALKYNDLSQNRNTDIVFDWDTMLDFKGNSAPYLQYTYARLRSIGRKVKKSSRGKSDLSLLKEAGERSLMQKTLQFQEAAEDAVKEYLPNLLCNYLWELANLANAFYEKYSVLQAAPDLQAARIALIKGTARVLKEGLSLLGIEAPEQV